MTRISSTLQSFLTNHPAVHAEVFVLMKPKTFGGGVETPLGYWTGVDDGVFSPDGTARTYKGAGVLLDVGQEPVTYGLGFSVRTWQFRVAIASPAIASEIRGYDFRLAPIEVYRGIFDTANETLIETPHRILKGRVQSAPITETEGGSMECVVTCTTAAIDLTRNMADKMNDNFQQLRSGDRFLRYAAVSGTFPSRWKP